MANDIHGHDLYANHLDDNRFCKEHREALRQELWDYVRESTADAVESTGNDAAAAKMYLEQIKAHDNTVQLNMEQTIQYANQAKGFSDNSDKKAQEVQTNTNRVAQLHAEVENNTNTSTANMNTAIQKAAESSSSATLARSWAIGDTGTREGEANNCSKAYCLRAEDAYNKLVGSLRPKGEKTIDQLKALGNDDKVESFMYTITDKFITDETFNCAVGTTCFPGTVVYWKDGKWNLISSGSGSSVLLDKEDNREISISKSDTKPNSASEIAIWDGDTVKSMDTKKLFQMMYPVGSIYMSTENTNPSTFIGGTWEAWGSGRVPVGIKANDENFDTPDQIGGSLTHNHTHNHTHTINGHEHTMAHTHTINSHDHTMAHSHTINGHTHTIAHTHTGPSHTHTTGNFTLSTDHIPAHTHGSITLTGTARISENIGVNGGVEFGMSKLKEISGIISSASTHGNVINLKGGCFSLDQAWRYDDQFTVNASHTHTSVGGGYAHNHGSTGASGTGNTGGSSASSTGGSGTLTSNGSSAANTGGSGNLTSNGSSAANTGGSGTLTSNSPNNSATNSSSTLQPYIVCYMWRRTA